MLPEPLLRIQPSPPDISMSPDIPMYRKLPGTLLLATFVLLMQAPLAAGQPFFPFQRPDDSLNVAKLIERYLSVPEGDTIHPDRIGDYAADEFEERLKSRDGATIRFAMEMPYRVVNVRPIHPDGSFAIATVSSDVGQIPLFGPMAIDWVFFTRFTEKGWRISGLRRQSNTELVVGQLRILDTVTSYPSSLKPVIARELSPMLFSNEQLRRHFNEHREKFLALAGHFHRRDSLHMLARVDRVISQVNLTVINWGPAAQHIPKEAVDEVMRTASAAEKKYIQNQLDLSEKMRRVGQDTLVRVAKRLGYTISRLDSAAALMHELRVSFINARLPWPRGVQFTVAGILDDAIGYLYLPGGKVPYITSEEYFYLEELGNGWWMFRAT